MKKHEHNFNSYDHREDVWMCECGEFSLREGKKQYKWGDGIINGDEKNDR